MTKKEQTSFDSLADATRSRASFSGHGGALGAAGVREVSYDPDNCEDLREPGQSVAISPGPEGFEEILIGVEWDPIIEPDTSFLGKMMNRTRKTHVDLDIGCLYEMEDGTRGAIQAFGEKFGNFDESPYMALSGDERTGDADGHDEYILVNGQFWTKVKRILVYIYIYQGAPHWAEIAPKIIVDVPGENDLIVTLSKHDESLPLCAVGGLEQVRGGIKLVNYTEYFPGHDEMDRAFGFGLEWGDGTGRKA